jgi:hypothetical protein
MELKKLSIATLKSSSMNASTEVIKIMCLRNILFFTKNKIIITITLFLKKSNYDNNQFMFILSSTDDKYYNNKIYFNYDERFQLLTSPFKNNCIPE